MPKPNNHKEVIVLQDSTMEIVIKLASGNPGAIRVCAQLLSDDTDPDNFVNGLGNLFDLDTHGIYGSNIWILYKDVCGENVAAMVTLLRAVQLGYYSESDLWKLIDGNIKVEIEPIYLRVTQRLPNFNSKNNSISRR